MDATKRVATSFQCISLSLPTSPNSAKSEVILWRDAKGERRASDFLISDRSLATAVTRYSPTEPSITHLTALPISEGAHSPFPHPPRSLARHVAPPSRPNGGKRPLRHPIRQSSLPPLPSQSRRTWSTLVQVSSPVRGSRCVAWSSKGGLICFVWQGLRSCGTYYRQKDST